MNEGLTPFEMRKERLLFLAVSAALAGYAAFWVLGEAMGGDEPEKPIAEQTYVRAGALEPFPDGAGDVLASGDPADSWDPSVPRRYVQPKATVVSKSVEAVDLSPPPASVPAPPMLLPLPGPAPEFSEGLPRWPDPPSPAGER